MKKIGPYIIIKVSELPKKLTVDDLELLLTGKKHLRKYPTKRKPPVPYPGEEGVYPEKGEYE